MCSSGVTKLMTRFVLRPIRSGRFGVGVVMMFVSFHSWTDEKLRIQNNFVRCLETLCMGLDHRLATVPSLLDAHLHPLALFTVCPVP
jgi:hypothetical protein